MIDQYNELGYLILDLEDIHADEIIESIDANIDHLKTQEDGYHYSGSPRVFEAWKWNKYVLELARHPKILEALKLLYGRDPFPFQTINFKSGSNQPLHSDTIHFHTIPEHWMVGVWVALEDMDDLNGTLLYVPGSHKLPVYDLQDLGLLQQEYGHQFEAYAKYEEFIKYLVGARGLKVESFRAKKGQALVWAANLIHGGAPIFNPSRTRWSQAIHYYFKGCDHYYSPMFSDVKNGKIREKNLAEKDILGHKIPHTSGVFREEKYGTQCPVFHQRSTV